MKIASAEDMRKIDQLAVEQYKIPGIVLMENAGLHIFNKVESLFDKLINRKICIFAGSGNNGGDGFVAARHLHNKGVKVKVFIIGDKNRIAGDALVNLNIIEKMNVDVVSVESERDWDKVKLAVTFTDCLVDGLLGTGFKGELGKQYKRAIDIMNAANKPTISIDLPSGVNPDNGQVDSVAVKASYTITFSLPKCGLFFYPGASYVGQLTIADIGIPVSLFDQVVIRQSTLSTSHVFDMLPKRAPNTHKGECGRILVIAGSKGLTGAATLASMGALRVGAGLVTLGIAATLNDIMEAKLTEVMTQALSDNGEGAIGKKAVSEILGMTEQASVLAIGPGLGRKQETCEAVREIVQLVELPCVIDADALIAFAGNTNLFNELPALAILTPHPGEMSRLTGLPISEINNNRMEVARKWAVTWGHIVVLKGAPTVVAFPDGEVYINTTGNAGMATGGTGDVLTGMIAGLMGQGLSSHEAALTGVYLHGLAGDIVCHDGLVGMLASELLPAIPAAILGVLQQ